MSDLADALVALKDRQPAYARYRAYYDGRHNLTFATEPFRNAFGALFRALAYNRCGAVVDSIADRLAVEGWETEGDEGADIQARAMELWKASGLPHSQNALYVEALRAGDAYVIVWPDDRLNGRPRLTINKAHLISVIHDEEDPERIAFAVKCWQVSRGDLKGHWRVTTYWPDRIERLVTSGKRDKMPTDGRALVSYDADGPDVIDNPWGVVPVFAFANNAGIGEPGMSELRDIVPLQDGANKALADMLVSGEFVAFPQRWIVGYEPEIDPVTGELQVMRPGIDRMLAFANDNARLGQFDAADMEKHIAVQDAWDAKIARVSRLPMHWLNQTGSWPSGETLKTAEAPFVSKVKDRQREFGAAWTAAMAFALIADGIAPEAAMQVAPVWASAESRSETEFWTVAQLKQNAGVPQRQIWREAGYSVDEIAEFETLNTATRRANAEAFGRAFDRGEPEP